MARRKQSKRLACRFCREECQRPDDRDHRSYWVHNHLGACPARRDYVQALNGVHVGDVWRSRHATTNYHRWRVAAIRLGGCDGQSEPDVLLVDEDAPPLPPPGELSDAWNDYEGRISDWHLWTLVEHAEPVTRADEPLPVPLESAEDTAAKGDRRRTGDGLLWCADEWRSRGYRCTPDYERTAIAAAYGDDYEERCERRAVWAAYLQLTSTACIGHGWEWFCYDPASDEALFTTSAAAAPARRPSQPPPAPAPEPGEQGSLF